MLGSAVIVFRETLEAALIIAIVLGASRGLPARMRWVFSGVGLGLAGSVVVAFFAGTIADAAQGRGQELFNAGVLLVAVSMLAWHNIWMSGHARKHAAEMQSLGHDVLTGSKPLSAMLLVTALAVLREGAETVLFLYGLFAGGADHMDLLLGSLLGLAGGTTIGALLYFGLVRIPLGKFFKVTGLIVLLLAAGLAASAANYLVQANLLPVLAEEVWDSSALLSMESMPGRILHVLIGYVDRPSGIELVFYLVTLAFIGGMMRYMAARPVAKPAAA